MNKPLSITGVVLPTSETDTPRLFASRGAAPARHEPLPAAPAHQPERDAPEDQPAATLAPRLRPEPPAEPLAPTDAALPLRRIRREGRDSPEPYPQAIPPADPLPPHLHRAPVQRSAPTSLIQTGPDGFRIAVPEASLDVVLLMHKTRPTPQLARFQTLLRALCTLSHAISRAAMLDDRIELQVEEWRLVLGEAGPLHRFGTAFQRPEIDNAARQAARLAYFIDHHALALRLRVAAGAPDTLLADICQLVMQLHSPSAVILTPSRLVLGKGEFISALATGLDSLRPGAPLPALSPRYKRPGAVMASPTPSAFTGKENSQSDSELRKAESLAARLCIQRDSAALAAVFRTKPPETGPAETTPSGPGLLSAMRAQFQRLRGGGPA